LQSKAKDFKLILELTLGVTRHVKGMKKSSGFMAGMDHLWMNPRFTAGKYANVNQEKSTATGCVCPVLQDISVLRLAPTHAVHVGLVHTAGLVLLDALDAMLGHTAGLVLLDALIAVLGHIMELDQLLPVQLVMYAPLVTMKYLHVLQLATDSVNNAKHVQSTNTKQDVLGQVITHATHAHYATPGSLIQDVQNSQLVNADLVTLGITALETIINQSHGL
jgi:hypothetical protein